MDKERKKPEEFIGEMTSSLEADEELQLDVSQELHSHYEESVAHFKSEGKSDDESHELALKAFGDPKQVAEDLADSNKNRMKSRALIGLFLKRILTPTSLILTIFIGFHYGQRFNHLLAFGSMQSNPSFEKIISSLPESSRFLLYGDTSRPRRSAQQRAIWEKDQENKVYFANYARLLLLDFNNKSLKISYDELEKEFRLGESIDPDNSFYNYLLAAVLFDEGSDIKTTRNKKKNTSQTKFIIKDQSHLNAAIEELKKARKKPLYRRYHDDLLKERLTFFPESQKLEHDISKFFFTSSTLLPEIAPTKNLFASIPHYVEAQKLNGEEASSILDTWQDFVKKATPDAWCLIDVLVIDAIISISGEKVSEVYHTLGKTEAADKTREMAKKANKPVADWKNQRETGESYDFLTKQKGSFVAGMLLPAIAEPIKEEDLRPGRMVERIIGEQFVLTLVVLIFGIMLIFSLAYYIKCKGIGGSSTAPVLLIPSGPMALKIITFGILLPIVSYYAYTRWTGMSSYEFSLGFEWPRGLAELLLLAVTYLSVSTYLAATSFTKRCMTLGIPTVRMINPIVSRMFWICLSLAWLVCIAKNRLFGQNQAMVVFLILGILPALIFVVLVFLTTIKAWRFRRTHSQYFGSVSRSLLPVYACAVVFLGLICLPYSQQKESDFLNQDSLFNDSDNIFITAIENKVTQRLRKSMTTALSGRPQNTQQK